MAKFAKVDKAGNPIAFYVDDVHDQIPADAIPIPDADWQAHIDGKRKVWDGRAWFPYKPNAAEQLAQAQAAKLAELRAAYQAALEAGVQYQGAKFESDDHSQLEVAKALTAIANGWQLPAGFAWVDAANNPHPVPDVAWLQGLAQALADHKAVYFARFQKAKVAVRAAKIPADVAKVGL
jgi:hypothetical protein